MVAAGRGTLSCAYKAYPRPRGTSLRMTDRQPLRRAGLNQASSVMPSVKSSPGESGIVTPSTLNCTPRTPTSSEADAVTSTTPYTVAPAAGAVTDTTGAVETIGEGATTGWGGATGGGGTTGGGGSAGAPAARFWIEPSKV